MKGADVARLFALAALWGASFLFMRVAGPAFGPAATADLRMLVAAAALTAYFVWLGFDIGWRGWAGQSLTLAMLAGALLVIAGTALVLRG